MALTDQVRAGFTAVGQKLKTKVDKGPVATVATATAATETAVVSWTIPANTLTASSFIAGWVFGQVSSTATLTYRVRIGPAATALTSRGVAVTYATTAAGAANAHTSVRFLLSCPTTTTVTGGGTAQLVNATSGPATAAYAAATINPAVDNIVSLTVQQSIAQTLTVRGADLTVLS